MRVTQNQMTRLYMNSSSTSLDNKNKILNKILTQRNFTRASEDSIGAAKALTIRNSLDKTDMYIDNLNTSDGIFSAGEGALMNMSSVITTIKSSILDAVNSTKSQEQKDILAQSIRQNADQLVAQMNTDYAGRNIFGGSNSQTTPFVYDAATGILSYNGTDVSTDDADAYAQNKPIYVDVGLGIKFDAQGKVDSQTALDISLSGVDYTGYGKDDDGDSKNVIQLAYDAATALEKGDTDSARRIMDKLETAKSEVLIGVTTIGNKEKSIELSLERVKDDQLNLKSAQNTVEACDVAEEATNFKVAEMAYNATLAMGGKVIPNSIFDFMR